MGAVSYSLPFGDGHLVFNLPAEWQASPIDTVNRSYPLSPLAPAIIQQKLEDFARQICDSHPAGQPVIAVFTDATRACPDQQLLEPMTRILHTAGIPVKFLCATGMHRPSTTQEKVDKLGSWLVENFEVIDHDATHTVTLEEVNGVPLEVNPLLQQGAVLMVGLVEPHQYAGYSGGAKTAVIGCGGANTIAITHGPQFLEEPGTRLGQIEGNPFQDFIRAGGKKLGLKYAVNVVLTEEGEIALLETGAPDMVHDSLIAQARLFFETPVPHAPYDIVIAGIGAPKDVNLYQASRAATYIGLSARPVIRQGGGIICPAPLPEGAGQGIGEKNFFQALQDFGPTLNLIQNLQTFGCKPGEQRAYMLAKLAENAHVIIVGAENPALVRQAWLHPAADMAEAARIAFSLTKVTVPRLLIVPHALGTIPVPAD